MPEFTNVYFKMSTGNGNLRGPWNKEPTFECREATPAVDGGDGLATVTLDKENQERMNEVAGRLMSGLESDPVTGAMLGMGEGTNAAEGNGHRAVEFDRKAAAAQANGPRLDKPPQ